ncbi:MAG: hypothetical protein A2X23_10365 [Chloroflexi bacterium GWC2_73_18]|nr:MAG: hypothetical protein A2X23_10365 [Chloroflexi bacterium GWC2_73_18]
MTTRSTITRAALALALLALAGILIWVGATRASNGQTTVAVLILLSALLPLAAAGLLFIRPGIGAALAIFAALLGAFWGLLLSFCLGCSPTPVSTESIALLVAAAAVFALALVELVTLGLAWVAIAIAVVVFALVFSSNLLILAAGLVVAAVVAWLMFRRRGSGSGA